jgi:hypothetical protein
MSGKRRRRIQNDDDDDDAAVVDDAGVATARQFATFIEHTPVITLGTGLTPEEEVLARDTLLKSLLKNMKEVQRRRLCVIDKVHFKRICDGHQLYMELVEEYYPEFAGWENKRAIVGGVPAYDATDGSWAVYFRGLHKSDQIRDACSDFLRTQKLSRLLTQTTPATHVVYHDRCFYHFPMGEEERLVEREAFLTTHPTGIASAAANAGRPRYEDAQFPWREFYFFLLERHPAMRPLDPRLLLPIDEEYQLRAELFIVDRSQEIHSELRRVKRRLFGDGPFSWVPFATSLTNARILEVITDLYHNFENVSRRAKQGLLNAVVAATQPDVLLLMMQPGGLYAGGKIPPMPEATPRNVLAAARAGVSMRNQWRLIGLQMAVEFGNATSVQALLSAYVGDWLLNRTYFLPWAVKRARTSVLQLLIDVDELIFTSAVSEDVGADVYRWWWFDVSRDVIREHWRWWQTQALSNLPWEDISQREIKKRALLKKLFDPVKGTKRLLTTRPTVASTSSTAMAED